MHDLSFVNNTLLQPAERPGKISQKAQWLSGEGAGSWFELVSLSNNIFEINRYNPKGKIECAGVFECVSDHDFDSEKPYTIVHLSHCKKVNIIQDNKHFVFSRTEKII